MLFVFLSCERDTRPPKKKQKVRRGSFCDGLRLRADTEKGFRWFLGKTAVPSLVNFVGECFRLAVLWRVDRVAQLVWRISLATRRLLENCCQASQNWEFFFRTLIAFSGLVSNRFVNSEDCAVCRFAGGSASRCDKTEQSSD